MEKIKTFFSKWGNAMAFSVWVVLLLFVLTCCIYTAVVRPFVGVTGTLAVCILLATTIYKLCKDIKKNL